MTNRPRANTALALMAWPGAIPEWLIALVLRLGVAGVFFLSGRTKVDGVLHITDIFPASSLVCPSSRRPCDKP